VWLDLTDDSRKVPICDGKITLKVLPMGENSPVEITVIRRLPRLTRCCHCAADATMEGGARTIPNARTAAVNAASASQQAAPGAPNRAVLALRLVEPTACRSHMVPTDGAVWCDRAATRPERGPLPSTRRGQPVRTEASGEPTLSPCGGNQLPSFLLFTKRSKQRALLNPFLSKRDGIFVFGFSNLFSFGADARAGRFGAAPGPRRPRTRQQKG
jgi:hypothetical protein